MLSHRIRASAVVALSLVLAGCSEQVRLSTGDGKVALSYACDRPSSQAQTPAAQQLLKEYAALIGQDARIHDRIPRLDPLLSAYAAEDFAALEEQVVAYLCEFGDVRAAVRAAERPPVFPETGSAALPFELPLLSLQRGAGTPFVSSTARFRLEEQRGKVVVLNFWATRCHPCLEKHPELVELAERYRDRGVLIYGIVHRESPATAAQWLRENGGESEYRMLVDSDGAVGRLYRVQGIPRTFIIGSDGRIAQATWGHFSGLEEAIQTLLREPA
ncbi:MAG TPA: TlpA disulfide reductase family protein [Longimicrobiaceae bacterium]|nr:TlpA disulfide reductase family protein [Longimicrobiaceae bacterium]